MNSMIDIIGMHEWDNTLFDEMILPNGIDKNDAINTIKLTCRELEINLPDPKFLKFAIGVWSKRNYYYFEEMYKTLFYEYVPIENYDKYEEINIDTTRYNSHNMKENVGGTTTEKPNETNTYKKASYNESTATERDINVRSGTNETTIKNDRGIAESTNGTDKQKTVSHIHGNIGVMTAMQAIEEQRRIVNISILDIVATSFKTEFCLLIY